MNALEGLAANRAPLFNGSNYALWSVRMKTNLMSLGFDVWMSIVNGSIIPSTPPIDADGKKAFESITKAMNAILCGLSETKFVKVMQCDTAKDMWEKLQKSYEGDDKVKKAKFQTHRMQFESLRMQEQENVAAYILTIDGVVNSLKGLGEKVEDSNVVQKILRSLPLRFDAKVSAIEKIADLDKMTVDKLHGILTTYEMRTNMESSSKKETAFKALKKSIDKQCVSSESSNGEFYYEEAHFVRKLKRGSRKYKGKLPLK